MSCPFYLDKIECMYFNYKGDNSTLNGGSLKLGDKFTYIESSVSLTENINTRKEKAIIHMEVKTIR